MQESDWNSDMIAINKHLSLVRSWLGYVAHKLLPDLYTNGYQSVRGQSL